MAVHLLWSNLRTARTIRPHGLLHGSNQLILAPGGLEQGGTTDQATAKSPRMSILKASLTKENEMATTGEYRVGISFNPTGNKVVDKVDRAAADFIDLVKSIAECLQKWS